MIFEKIARHFGGDLEGRTFALWGLAFKPNTDDMREAASRVLMEALWAAGARCRPTTRRRWRRRSGSTATATDLVLSGTKEAALKGADALVIMTEWQAFRAPGLRPDPRSGSTAPVIFDGRNLYDPARLARRGFAYYAIGRGAPSSGPPEMRVILVTGSAGFIGFHVADGADAPRRRGDRASTSSTTITTRRSRRPGSPSSTASPPETGADWRFHRGDIADRAARSPPPSPTARSTG